MTDIDWNSMDEADEDGGEGRYVTLEPDTYDFVVASAESTKSSNNNPMIVMTLEVEDGPFKGKWVDNYSTYTEKAKGIFKANLKALGIYEEGMEKEWTMEQTAKAAVGKRCRGKVINQPGDDRVFNNIKGTLKPPSDGEQPETPASLTANDPF